MTKEWWWTTFWIIVWWYAFMLVRDWMVPVLCRELLKCL